MKITKSYIINLIQEVLRESREVITIEPGTKEYEPKVEPSKKPNPLMPPKTAPKPTPKGAIDDIVKRFKSLKENDKGRYNQTKKALIPHIRKMINEVSLETLQAQFVDTNKISADVFNEIKEVSGGKSAYATWLVQRVIDKSIIPEDLYKWKGYLSLFNRRSKEYPSADINAYKSANDIKSFILKTVELKSKEAEDPSQQKGVTKTDKYKEFYIGNVDGFNVYKLPKGRFDLYPTSCELGSGTEWCTATGKTDKHFKNYISKGPLFIFIKPGSTEKYQFCYESGDFRDKNDSSVF